MSKWKSRLMKRVLALVLSGSMIMSDAALFRITAYAAETEMTTGGGDVEEFSEEYSPETQEVTVDDDRDAEGNVDEKGDDTAKDAAADDAVADDTADNDRNEDPADDTVVESVQEPAAEDGEDADSAQDAAAEETESKAEDSEVQTSAADSDTEKVIEAESAEEKDSQEAEVEEKTEEEASDAEVSEEDIENMAGTSMSFSSSKDNLKAGTEYGDDILKFSVLEDMNYKKNGGKYENVSYSGVVLGTNNPAVGKAEDGTSIPLNDENGWIPKVGAAFKIMPVKASKITFIISKAGTSESRKTYYYVKDDGAKGQVVQEGLVPLDVTSACTIDLDAGSTYYFYLTGSKVSVYAIQWEERQIQIDENTRKPWGEVAVPVIETPVIDTEDPSKINVTVNGAIGVDGADRMIVSMCNSETPETVISSVTVEMQQDNPIETKTVTFAPTASGTYLFKAELVRDSQQGKNKVSDPSAPVEFTCPLVAPKNLKAESIGDGKIQLKWDAVPEVDKYIVEVVDHPEIKVDPVEGTKTTATVSGLTIGTTYSFTVYAVRGEGDKEQKSEKSEPVSCKAEALKLTWEFARFGNGAGKTNNGMSGEGSSENGYKVTLYSKNGAGKLAPASTDGLAFYYTKISSKKNFTFTAKAHVNSWKFSNGQEGFGVMASDRVGKDGSGGEFWNNSYQAVVSKIGYNWNGTEISKDGTGEKISMELGVGSTEKVGVESSDLTLLSDAKIKVPKRFKASQEAIDSTFAKYGKGTYNMVDNFENADPPVGSNHELYTDFELQIQKNNTGYFVSYTKLNNDGSYILDSNGNKITTTQKYYDTDALNHLDKNNIYVGVFTSRNANVTFTDMKLDLVDPADDKDPEYRDVTYYNLATSVLSSPVTNSSEYQFIFHSNWKGKLVLKDAAGTILTQRVVKDEEGKDKKVDYYDVEGSLDYEKSFLLDGDDEKNTKVYIDLKDEKALSIGKNVFTVEYTPDQTWCPDVDKNGKRYAELSSYDKVTLTYTVEYRKYGEPGQTIYVSQYGKSTNTGTKESPLDIYTAVKYAQPGQTILLAGGTYGLNRTLQTPKGVDGKPKEGAVNEKGVMDWEKEDYQNFIKMMAEDPDNRPVLDFMGLVPAMVTVGNYWYFKNFDVIRCKDGEKGIQVSSSYCVFDRVDTYKNGSTGLQISRLAGQDTYKDWPSYNWILNCNSYLNSDKGFEDADGFAAKLTSGSGNVFDGCIAAFNADDGWDLFAKVQSGSIGAVTIRNSIAYRNGYLLLDKNGNLDENGELKKLDGNGNGFKMGGDGMEAGTIYDPDYDPDSTFKLSGHKLENSLAFYNKLKGFDANSCPNVKAYNSVSFNNDDSNIGFSTSAKNPNTDYELKNVISFRTSNTSKNDGVSGKGTQSSSKINNTSTYKWSDGVSKNSNGATVTKDDFVSLTYDCLDHVDKDYWRNEDGTINTHGFLQLKDTSQVLAKPSMGGTSSNDVKQGEDTIGNITGAIDTEQPEEDYGEDFPKDGIDKNSGHFGKIWVADINYIDYTDREPIYYTGKQITPELHVRFSADVPLLRKGKDYTVKYENNINAGTATAHVTGVGSYKGFTVDKTFEIKPIDINPQDEDVKATYDYPVAIPSQVAVLEGGDSLKEIKPTWIGRALKKDKDYTAVLSGNKITVTGMGNFTGTKTVDVYTTTADKLLSKASVKITTPAKELTYTGDKVKPACEVKLKGSTLTLNTDYEVDYANNVEIGKATLIVTGKGNYFGSKTVNFSIKGGNLKTLERDGNLTVEKGSFLTKYESEGVVFTGSDCEIPENTIKLTLKSKDVNGKETKLKKDYDYKIVQKGTNKAGTATVTIKGINGYTGSLSYKYKITAKDINEIPDKDFVYYNALPYTAGGAKYDAGVNFNIRLGGYYVDTRHYALSYKNNTAAGEATVVVTGRNGLTGKKTLPFTVARAVMTDNTDIVVTAKDVATNGKELKYSDLKKSKITVTQSYMAKGKVKTKKLSAGRDYDKKAIKYYIDKNNNYVIDPDEEKEEITDKISTKDTVPGFKDKGSITVLVRVSSNAENPKCNYEAGYVDGYFRVALYDINRAKVKNNKSRVYGMNWKDGNGLSIAIDWSDREVAKIEEYLTISYKTTEEVPLNCNDPIGDYKKNKSNTAKYCAMDGFVIDTDSYKKNDRVGTASFTIIGTGKYCGTKKVTFKIVNKETAKKLIAKGKANEVETLKNNVQVSVIKGNGSVLASLKQPDENSKKSSRVNIIAERGESVYLSQKAAAGFAFDKWECLEGTGLATVEIESDKFIMPEENVSIGAVFKEVTQPVSGKFIGLDGKPLTGVSVTKLMFKNTVDGSVYEAVVKDDGYTVNLRQENSYTAEITAKGYKETQVHFEVKKEALVKDLLLVEENDTPLERRADLYVGYSDQENNYQTINAALKDAKRMNPQSEEERITIHIYPGTYREQVFVNTNYITLINDTPEKEVKITWYYGIGYAYYSVDETGYYNETCAFYKDKKRNAARWGCAVRVKATDFKAKNIVFENSFNRYITEEEIADGVELSTAGTDSKATFKRTKSVTPVQAASKDATERAAALALDTGSDRSEFYNCKFLGSQDTLYTGNRDSRAYYKNCFISGNTDYIFGDGNQVFEDCELNWQGYTSGANGGHITAAKDTSTLGYLFYNCKITKNKDSGFSVVSGTLGRTWGAKARVTFVNTEQETSDIIVAAGWASMNGDPKNANYKEYNTTSADGKTISFNTSPRKEIYKTANPIDTPEKLEAYFGDWTPAFYGGAGTGNE